MNLKYCIIKFDTGTNHYLYDAEKLRGFFGNLRIDNDLYHNHTSDGKDMYRFPKIQYKVINGKLSVIGIEEGADFVKNEFLQTKTILLKDKEYNVYGADMEFRNIDFSVDDKLYSYKFLTPWMALNEKNYIMFQDGLFDFNIGLRNNLLSDFKGLGIRVDKKIMVNGKFRREKIKIMKDNVEMIGFYGEFVSNVKIPPYFGTGKFKSIGYGVIVEEGRR